jgi:undecaprenyl-diphosphatase
MNIIHALVLGVVQGLGEFLPISSSGHLVLVPYIFNWQYQGLDFDIALHMGTILAIIAYFWHDWVEIIGSAISVGSHEDHKGSYPKNIFWVIVVASIPAALGGYFLENLAQHALRNPLLIAMLLAFFALLLLLADKTSHNNLEIKKIGYTKGFLIGIAQAISLFPGVSRSGITTTAGMFLNLDRKTATKFSFLLATPAVLGAFLISLKDYQTIQIELAFFVAIFASAISGFFAIKYLLKFLEKHGFMPFVIYRLALAALVMIIYFSR